MSEYTDPDLAQIFAESQPDILQDETFTQEVLKQTDKLKRRRMIGRIILALAMTTIAAPVQDFAMILTEVMVHSVVSINNQLLAEILAPINTVGAALSATLFGIRAMYKRLFV
jgi:hypothetical protein